MFEDFSFTSPTSRSSATDPDDHLSVNDSTLISPLSSRCPSPQHRLRNSRRFRQPPTSVPFPYADPKPLSIATLTQKLHEHTLSPSTRPSHPYPGYVLTPPDTDHSDDGIDSPSTSPTFYPPDLVSDLPDLGLGVPFYPDVRAQRQQISRLQCNQSEIEAMQRSLMEAPELDGEDWHPSSLPPRASPRRRALTLARSRFGPEGERGRRRSSVVLSSRVEKNGKRNEQGLRRKSLVSAALASMVERED
ncbi:hypothetical protein N7457_007430 [Penicillium paradoxum]|uniref:uncharacterized protein n=1 Tax=Penicillium paradoxum TaxID=176176 RepID=UPI0025489A85|nr:uncharacterized protein N7457_007430 [Penicillium paradoxum]KAJ5779710.1 hypothetical protein N7457_007430 [Penicillium paradoxum]